MAAVDFVQLALEEQPLNEQTYDDAATPSRIATDVVYPPARSARIAPTPSQLSRADELRGLLAEVPRLVDNYAPAGVLSSYAYPDMLTWILALSGFDGVHTAGNGAITDPDLVAIPTGAHRWVYTKRNSLDARTARIMLNYARENMLLTGYGFGITSLGITAAAELSAELRGLYMRRAVADTSIVPAVPAASLAPFRRGDLYISALSGGGRIADWSLQISNPIEAEDTLGLNPASLWPDAMSFAEGMVAATGSIPKRVLDIDDYDALVAATTFAMTARWTHPTVIASSYPYKLYIEMPGCQYLSGEAEELTGSRRRRGSSYDFFAAYDTSAGYDVKITLVNATSAILTGSA